MMKFKSLFFSLCMLTGAQLVSAQTINNDNRSAEQQYTEKYKADRIRAEQMAKERNLKLRYTEPSGKVVEFAGFDDNGKMLYNETHNVGAGRTISTNKVWPGGTTGTTLTGIVAGNRLGVWDGGAVRVAHQEFGGRVVQADAATSISDHSTHVAGTMVGSGVSANAKGMSYQANLRAYDWNNDNGEMTAAAGSGMLISNHSYGTICGWYNSNGTWYWYGDAEISETTDYKFGFYDSQAAAWDNIARNNPYFLICKSAGNDRSDTHTGTHYVRNANSSWVQSTTPRNADGQYDCISTYGTAKNILTVGAVSKINNSNTNNGWTMPSDVVMSYFSGWGPTDDGRIKPDVVGAGVNLYSSTGGSNTAYGSLSGTSMATPNVSGSLLLVQQHYNNLQNKFMRSASLKGLIIHTADEAGDFPGPDYSNGWGLVNIAKAVQVISDSAKNQIIEHTLNNNSTYIQSLVSDGTLPMKVTICWTDRAGVPVAPALNPTNLMLVNDLDIRLIRKSDSMIYKPYILDPANPSAAATTGDNFRDNVEQIYIAAPSAGEYTLVLTHKGTLSQSQAQPFSLIISGSTTVKPVADFFTQKTTICKNTPINFFDLSQNAPTRWSWTFEGALVTSSSVQNPTGIVYDSTGTYSVKLKIGNSAGSDSITLINYITVINEPDQPVITTDFSGTAFCRDTSVILTVNSTDTVYQWYRGGFSIVNATEKSYTVTGSGTYTVVVSNASCSSLPSAGLTFTLLPKPASLAITGANTSFVDSVEIYSAPLRTGSTYEWTVANGTIRSGNGTNKIEVVWGNQNNGEVKVQERNADGCPGDVFSKQVSISQLQGIGMAKLEALNVYPNPASDLLTISFNAKQQQTIRMTLANLLGQSVVTHEQAVQAGKVETQIKLQSLIKGVYILKIEGKDGTEMRKIIVN